MLMVISTKKRVHLNFMKNRRILSDKIALMGDLHLGVNKNNDRFYHICDEWVDWFLDELKNYDIKDIFVLGDWFHYRDEISVNTLDYSANLIEKLTKNHYLHILTGNHDCYLRDTSEIHSLRSYVGWDKVYIYDKPCQVFFKSSGKSVTVIPWGVNPSDVRKKGDYIFGHFEINNFKMNNFKVCKDGIESKSLVTDKAKVYTGHFHKYQTIQYKNGGEITYVGSPYQHDFNDVGCVNGFHVLDTINDTCVMIENEISPRFFYLYLSNLKEDCKKENIENNFVRIKVDIEIKNANVMDKIIMAVQKMNPLDIEVDDRDHLPDYVIDDNIDLESFTIEESIEEYVKNLSDKDEDKILKKLRAIKDSVEK